MTLPALLVAALLAGPGSLDVSKRNYDLGVVAYESGRFKDALDDFQKAYQAAQLDELLYNIAQCHRALGQLIEARTFYERYLARPEIRERVLATQHLSEIQLALPPEPPPPLIPTASYFLGAGGVVAAGLGFGAFGVASAIAATGTNPATRGSVQDQVNGWTGAEVALFVTGGALVAGAIVWAVVTHNHAAATVQ